MSTSINPAAGTQDIRATALQRQTQPSTGSAPSSAPTSAHSRTQTSVDQLFQLTAGLASKFVGRMENVEANRVQGNEGMDPSAVVESLSDEDLKECLRCASEWNTNSKLYLCGQMLLRNVFSRIHPDRLGSISGLEDVWNGLISYSDRHAKRIDTLVRSTYLLDYALSSGFMHKKDNNENNVTASD